MNRVLVTGGAGMIGSNLVKKLIKHKYSVKVVDNLWRGKKEYLQDKEGKYVIDMNKDFYFMDLSVPDICDAVMKDVDYVVHFADIVGGIGYVFNNQGSLFRQNLLINTNTIASARKSNLKGFVYIGTACSFPENKQNQYEATALVESDLYPAMPESAYGWSKLMGQYETKLMEKEKGIPSVSVMLHNVYGSPADFSVERSQVIPSLVRKAIKYPEEDFVIWGSGNQSRAFIHVSDVTDGILLAMEKGLGQNEIQLGPSYATTIREIAELVVKISGKDIPIKYDTSKPEGDKARCADYTKAKDILGWQPKTSLQDGVQELYDWVSKMIKQSSVAEALEK